MYSRFLKSVLKSISVDRAVWRNRSMLSFHGVHVPLNIQSFPKLFASGRSRYCRNAWIGNTVETGMGNTVKSQSRSTAGCRCWRGVLHCQGAPTNSPGRFGPSNDRFGLMTIFKKYCANEIHDGLYWARFLVSSWLTIIRRLTTYQLTRNISSIIGSIWCLQFPTYRIILFTGCYFRNDHIHPTT